MRLETADEIVGEAKNVTKAESGSSQRREEAGEVWVRPLAESSSSMCRNPGYFVTSEWQKGIQSGGRELDTQVTSKAGVATLRLGITTWWSFLVAEWRR